MKAHVVGDVVIGLSQDGAGGVDVPDALAGLSPDQLFFVNGAIVDGRALATFYIDANGGKHAAQLDPSWQAVACKLGDRLVQSGGAWALPSLASTLISYAAAARYTKEIAGITVAGIGQVATDRDSQALITGLRWYAADNPSAAISFTQGGASVQITAAQAIAMFSAVAAHVQACRAAEAQLVAGIAAAPPTVTTTAQIDAAFAAIAT